jgi:hypothetical protein
MNVKSENVSGSFRDPSGFLFVRDGLIYRQINSIYQEHYNQLMESGFYQTLIDSGLMVSHEDVGLEYARSNDAFKIIKPQLIPFVSYPYEWCFSQLKDAALITLEIQKTALDYGMSLKDSSAYNIQFLNSKPVLIDTLSFEKYREGYPWVTYKQFCEHFLAPLALMSYTDIRLNQLLRVYIDGIPLDLASSLLPVKTKLKFGLLTHIHLHAKSQKHYADKKVSKNIQKFSRRAFMGLLDNLETVINKLTWRPVNTEWAEYYDEANYSSNALDSKKQLVADLLTKANPRNIWDLGANDGTFSHIGIEKGIPTISFDIDPACVEKNYLDCKKEKRTGALALLLDLINPSPGIGWENLERTSLLNRGPADTILALALIHHLAISNNLPLSKLAIFFSKLARSLIIEFVPKNDSQVQRLLSTREDIFIDYTQDEFEKQFSRYFQILESKKIEESERTLYLMQVR